jgi:hypothetical protein
MLVLLPLLGGQKRLFAHLVPVDAESAGRGLVGGGLFNPQVRQASHVHCLATAAAGHRRHVAFHGS